MTKEAKNNILVLPSWYPSKLDIFNGDFIQRHIQAIGSRTNQYVIYVVKDNDGLITNDVTSEKNTYGHITELKCYYKPFKTGFGVLDKLISQAQYIRLYKKAINVFISERGLPSVVHVHVAFKAGILANWLKQKYRIPYIVTEHWTGYFPGSEQNIYSSNPVKKKITKKIVEQANLVLPVTKNLGEIIKVNFANINYKVIPNVADTSMFFYKVFSPATFRFIHPSGMNIMKNPLGILQACKVVKEKGFNFELLMVGQIDENLISAAKEYGINTKVLFKGIIPYNEIAKEMQQSSALLLFSRFENLPCVILEAFCCGLPVISSNVGGINEVVNSTNGILVESENIEQLAAAMCQLIDNYDVYNRTQIALAASEKFNYNTVAEQYTDVYENISGIIA